MLDSLCHAAYQKPMTSITEKLSEVLGAAFAAQDLPVDLGVVRVSDRPDLAQFQCNGAMAAAKLAKAAPRQVAEKIVEIISQNEIFSKIEIAGPGFINLNITDAYLTAHLSVMAGDPRLGIAQSGGGANVVLDYGGPNIAKPMHVGHLRSSIIGDCLRRLYGFAGYNALGDVHMGDWGTQMGQIISELEIRGELGRELSMQDLEEIYPAASKACKEDDARADLARSATVKLQNGDENYRAVWKQFIDVSIDGMKANFDALGVHFDLWKGESSVHDLIAPMVDRLKEMGLAHEDDGAVVIDVAQDDDTKEIPPLILYKRDGAVMYGTTDLATIVERVAEFDPALILYIVDQRQSLHFEQVFRAARKGDIAGDETSLVFAGFGTMNGTDGKPFKTRAGGVMKLEDLISMAREKALARLDEANLAADMDTAERNDIANKVGIAALKFADLQNNRIADYVFDLDRMTSFEGKTGPYLLYQVVRIHSLLSKAGDLPDRPVFNLEDEDRKLALMLAELPDHFEGAIKNNAPHILCDYAFKLAQAFSSFYGNCHILSESNDALRRSRISLCMMSRDALILILSLLGIDTPKRM